MYKIGTRGSLLAVTQCTLIKHQLEALTGEEFTLELIKTQGDQIVDRPLWQLEGKDFFTKELDEALLNGVVDLVVHSYKDLGSERPPGIQLAAITERLFAHDVLLIPKTNVARLKDWQGDFIVGTSSPRRIVNLTRDLPSFLPHQPTVRCETLRGNINGRIQKLRDGKYHAITLALAGLERLAHLESSQRELTKLLADLTFAVLPLSLFPTAAAQGALAIETLAGRKDQGQLASLLAKVHHGPTAAEVRRERAAFKSYGGGCHLAVGIHVRGVADDFLHFHRGENNGVSISVKKREGVPAPVNKPAMVFLGSGVAQGAISDALYVKRPTEKLAPVDDRHVFVTTAHALPSLSDGARSIWAAGPHTRKKIVAQGQWVHGDADSLGTEELLKLASSRSLQLMMGEADWLVLSHALASSPVGEVFPAYTATMEAATPEQRAQLAKVSHAWWASFPQYQAYLAAVPELKNAEHFCGLGKTWNSFQAQGVPVVALSDQDEFLQLMGLK